MSKDHHLGYLIIDHRNSPGISEEMAHDLSVKSGKQVLPMPKGQIFERDTYRCSHCQAIVLKNPLRERPRNYCRKCDAYVCDNPGCNAGCLPMAQVFDKANSAAHKNQAVMAAVIALRRDVLGR